MLSIHFFCYFSKRKQFLPPAVYAKTIFDDHFKRILNVFWKKQV